jgi:hypothetical protein
MRFSQSIVAIAIGLLPMSVSAQPRRRIAAPQEIVEEIIRDTTSYESLPRHLDSLAANLEAVKLDLNGDGSPELEIRGINVICGANNCPAWIYRRAGNRYERLLSTNYVQTIEVQSGVSHGYRDIMTARHGSAWDSDLSLFQFDGHEYRRVRCFDRRDRYLDSSRRPHELKRPRITPRACRPE